MNPIEQRKQLLTDEAFSVCLAPVWVPCSNSLLNESAIGQNSGAPLSGMPHFAPKAKRVIYLFQSGGPSQHELWDYKPKLVDMVGKFTSVCSWEPEGYSNDVRSA